MIFGFYCLRSAMIGSEYCRSHQVHEFVPKPVINTIPAHTASEFQQLKEKNIKIQGKTMGQTFKNAIKTARRARFEFGEKG